MYVCMCMGVSEAELRACVLDGARTVEQVGDRCAAGTGCGSCQERIAAILATATVGHSEWRTLPRSA